MFSKATEIALRAVIFIARKSSESHKLGLEEIATGINSPKSFTAKILQKLTGNRGIIGSSRGPQGGFYISDRNRNKSIRSVLMVMGEDEINNKCVLGLAECSERKPCPMHEEYKKVRDQIRQMFENKTIQSLAEDFAGQRAGTFLKLK